MTEKKELKESKSEKGQSKTRTSVPIVRENIPMIRMDSNGGLYHFHPRPTAFMRESQPLLGQYVAFRVDADTIRVGDTDYLAADYLIYDNNGIVVVVGG